MLEPRRLAARSAARYMAKQLGEVPGQTVGYRTRLDTRVSGNTRIEVVTEGILTRLIQNDPMLEDYAAVLFDEFHERSVQADLGLALGPARASRLCGKIFACWLCLPHSILRRLPECWGMYR